MKKSTELFELIKTLDGNEKRYFKILARANRSNSNLIKLFDAIAYQEEYNEREILNLFKNKSFTKQLHATKYRLYHLIPKY